MALLPVLAKSRPATNPSAGRDTTRCQWPNGRGYTFGRFNVVRNSCKFEKVDLIKSSGKGETYKARVACDNSGEDADDPEDHRIKHIDLIIQYVITQYDGDEGLIISNPSKVKR